MKTKKFYKTIRTIGKPLMKMLFRTKVVGAENIPNESGYILCCNHTHFMDVAFLIVSIPHIVCFMAKEELFRNKLAKWFLTKMGAFPVVRASGTAASAIKRAEEIVLSGDVTGIFPEGTRSKDGRPKKAKSGVAIIASQANSPVLPVSIYYEGKLKLFKKITVRIGKLISAENLALQSNDRAELKRVSTMIMDTITAQWEEGAC